MLAEIVEKQRAERFAGFQGADIRGQLPVQEALLQPLFQPVVQKSNGRIERLAVSIQEQNVLLVDLTVYLLFFRKNLRITLSIDPKVDFAISPLLRIRIASSEGIPAFVLDMLLAQISVPESITITPRLITINLKTILTRSKLDDFVPLIKQLSLSTKRGSAFIGFQIGVD